MTREIPVVLGRFWTVWREGGGPSTVPHRTRADADEEALRLAEKFPTEVFFVLKAVRAFAAPWPKAKELRIRRKPLYPPQEIQESFADPLHF